MKENAELVIVKVVPIVMNEQPCVTYARKVFT